MIAICERIAEIGGRADMNCTRETTPYHIWRHHVELLASRLGVTRDTFDAQRGRILAAFQAGEPVWMIVDELVAKQPPERDRLRAAKLRVKSIPALTSERANEIIAQARAKARTFGQWSSYLDKVMTLEERAQVTLVWETMPGHTCFVDALFRIARGKA
jgi:hypothetical protein